MVELLSFIVVVAVRMIDPISIVLAVALGALAAVPKDRGARLIVIGIAAVAMMIAFGLLASYHDSLLGVRQSGAWAPMRLMTTLTASGLQVALVAWLFGRWYHRGISKRNPDAA